jgi:hypothetical protein
MGEEPDLGNPGLGVEGKLFLPVPGLRGEAHLHQEEDVLWAGVVLGVEVLPGPKEEEVGEGQAVGGEVKGALHPDLGQALDLGG